MRTIIEAAALLAIGIGGIVASVLLALYEPEPPKDPRMKCWLEEWRTTCGTSSHPDQPSPSP